MPASALVALRRALVAELGAERAAAALRNAGHAAGDALFQILAQAGRGADEGDALGGIDADRFWSHLARLFSGRGWGTLSHQPVHPGVGLLESTDWAEAGPHGGTGRPSCFFTTGALANLLGQVAGSDVAVMEVECRSRGDSSCRFLFGSPAALGEVYTRVAAGEAADNALAQLS